MSYADQPRFPKIQTNGFERNFQLNYEKTLGNMLKNLGKAMITMVDQKQKHEKTK
jgi:hypothetical protein